MTRKPHQVLGESTTTASLALQLPVVVVQQLLQILVQELQTMKAMLSNFIPRGPAPNRYDGCINVPRVLRMTYYSIKIYTLSKCSKTRYNFFSATTTSKSFTTAGWSSSFSTAISLNKMLKCDWSMVLQAIMA